VTGTTPPARYWFIILISNFIREIFEEIADSKPRARKIQNVLETHYRARK
jgi:hypothetical protein